jgi:hypothetical protein
MPDRHIEVRQGHLRAHVCLRDQGTDIGGVDARVEMTFRIGGQLYALEHTGIEPFDGFVEMNNEADRLFEPLGQSLTGVLDPSSAFELTIQLHALRGRRMNDVKQRHDALRQWVLDTAPTIPKRPYGDLRCGHADGTVMNMPVTLRPTNVPLVCDAYLEAIKGRADIPDETWLVSTEHDPWYAHPLLVGGRTYYDHAQEFRGAVGWQVDPNTMTITRLP